MTKYKMMVNWKEYDGAYTVDECGENVKVALNSMPDLYNPSFTFTKVNDDGSPYTIKSTKKSKPTSFSDMVKKQRAKNSISKYDEDEGETEYRETLQELYRVIAPKIKSTSGELVNILEQVTSYETVGDFGGSEGHVIDDCIFRMRELLDSLEEGIESANNDFW